MRKLTAPVLTLLMMICAVVLPSKAKANVILPPVVRASSAPISGLEADLYRTVADVPANVNLDLWGVIPNLEGSDSNQGGLLPIQAAGLWAGIPIALLTQGPEPGSYGALATALSGLIVFARRYRAGKPLERNEIAGPTAR